MALQSSSGVVVVRDSSKKLVDDIENPDEDTFDRFNEETFSGMGMFR